MDKLENLAMVSQMIESAERNLQSAKQLLREILGSPTSPRSMVGSESAMRPAATVILGGGGKVIEGTFDGQNMTGPDGKQYPVPANYASKSKLVEGDILKLTIAEDGSFIYKQIGPIERKKILGVLMQDERGDFRVLAEGKPYRVLLASLTYFKAEPGDEVTIIVPQTGEAVWAAVENVIKKEHSGGAAGDVELHTQASSGSDEEMGVAQSQIDSEPVVAPEEEEF
jgi:hypothetical protein